eukprot:11524859-Prorocentrum_lima.AAC.1
MTSSLVGSEMCIRDSSAYSQECRWALRPTQTIIRHQGNKMLHRSGPPNPCLLYTSDAADDM